MAAEKKFDKVAYDNAYIAKAYDRINFVVPKGQKDRIKKVAEGEGKSVNAFIWDAVQEKLPDAVEQP